MTKILFTEQHIRRRIAMDINSHRVTQKEMAKILGISPQYLHDILVSRRGISSRIAKIMGFERIIYFQEQHGGKL